MNVRTWVTTLTISTMAPCAAAVAQVGHVPQRSPYIDLEYRQEATVFGGYFGAGSDAVGVAPQGGPMAGLRYDLRLGGPAYLTSKVAYVSSQRTVIDPRRPEGQRIVQTDASWPLYLADIRKPTLRPIHRRPNPLQPGLSAGVVGSPSRRR